MSTKEHMILTAIFCIVMSSLVILLLCTFVHAYEYTDYQIVNAIYKAEGGENATYLYGIRSVKYSTPQEARRICYNTVRNNRRRYAEYGYKDYGSYLEFLASRYAPTKGSNLSKAEHRLNKNWLKNVRYFLEKANKTD